MSELRNHLQSALRNRYAIRGELARGGMATVFLAEDLKHKRRVAIKVPAPEIATSIVVKRFLQEVAMVSQLSHPNILPLYDSGSADGILYCVMPYIEGKSLRERLEREKQLPVIDAVRIAREVADGLSYAHQYLIHRDIKPENILLSTQHAVLADFGIASALEAAAAPKLTSPGLIVGTPVYMSPEQAAGEGSVDERSDLYSLGCVLYEMLAGEVPLLGPTSAATWALRVSESPPPLRQIRAHVPAFLESLITKALEPLPADRFQSASEFTEALEAVVVLLEAPEAALAASIPKPLPASRRRRSLLVAAAAAAAIGAAAIVARISDGPVGGSEGRLHADRVVVAPFVNLAGEPDIDTIGNMASYWITHGLQRMRDLHVTPVPTALSASRFARTESERSGADPVESLARETGAATVVSGVVFDQGNDIRFHVEVIDADRMRILASFEAVAAPRTELSPALDELRDRVVGFLAASTDERVSLTTEAVGRPPTFDAYREFSDGMDRYIRLDFEVAAARFRRAFELDTTFAVSMLYAAISHSNLSELEQADSALAVVETHRDELSDYHRHWLGYRRAMLRGDMESSLISIRRAAAAAPASKAVYNLAVQAYETNRPQEAIRALESLDPQTGPMRGWLPYWSVLTRSHHLLGKHETEVEEARQAMDLYPGQLRALGMQLVALAALGRLEPILSKLDSITLANPDDRGWLVGTHMRRTAEELRCHGHSAAAERVFDRALQWFRSQPPVAGSSETYRRELALLMYRTGRLREAGRLFDTLSSDAPEDLSYRGYQGLVAARQGDMVRALEIAGLLQLEERPYLLGRNFIYPAMIFSVLGNRERALALLQEAISRGTPSIWPHVTGSCDDFESLRSDPQYLLLTGLRE